MNFALDHVVIAVHDLAGAVRDYAALGFNVQPGGRHPGRTSHNALVVLEDASYLELIAWPEPGPAERWYNELAKHGEGLMDFALIPADVPRAIAEAKSRGLHLNGPIAGSRVRPDGRELQWQTGRQSTFDLPFLCGDITPREWRVPAGEARVHPNGARGIATVFVAVHDLEVSRARYEALLGTRSMQVGRTTIVLLDASSPRAAPRLESRGEGPCALTLLGPDGASGAYDAEATHGVPIDLES